MLSFLRSLRSSNWSRNNRQGSTPSRINWSTTWFNNVVLPICRGPRKTIAGASPPVIRRYTGSNAQRRNEGSSAIGSPRHHGLPFRITVSRPLRQKVERVGAVSSKNLRHHPAMHVRKPERVRDVLGHRARQIEHTGSTSVTGLAAKPIVDMLLVVTDSADENRYVPAMEAVGYLLRIRETNWHAHRMFKGPDTEINLHVFSVGCPEIDRILIFRDWLRSNAVDRDRYACTKLLGPEGVEVCPELCRCQDRDHRRDHRTSSRRSEMNRTWLIPISITGGTA